MKLWQCSICSKVGFWGPTWQAFSSFVVDDEWPSYRVVGCSQECVAKIEYGHTAGTIDLPKFRLRHGQSHMVRGPVGYKPQPEQRKLVEAWNDAHPTEQIAIELFR